jgi:hypothetical protein
MGFFRWDYRRETVKHDSTALPRVRLKKHARAAAKRVTSEPPRHLRLVWVNPKMPRQSR